MREDNADRRLRQVGYEIGLVSVDEQVRFQRKLMEIERLRGLFETHKVGGTPLSVIIRRSETDGGRLVKDNLNKYLESDGFMSLDESQQGEVIEQVEIQYKYDGYLVRQDEEVRRFWKIEEIEIPTRFVFGGIPGISHEIVEKLSRVRPISLGQASRVPGVTPAAVAILMVYLKRSSFDCEP